MTATVHLDPPSIEAVARRVAELIRGEDVSPELVDAAEIARRFGVSRDYVYEHSADLGVVKLGDGPRARLRFDPAVAAERLASKESAEAAGSSVRRRRKPSALAADLLPVRGRRP